jgi:PleD family two-component response regulator
MNRLFIEVEIEVHLQRIPMPEDSVTKGDILVVDDTAANLRLLGNLLTAEG